MKRINKLNPIVIFVAGWIISVIVGIILGQEQGMLPSSIIGGVTTLLTIVGFILKTKK